MRSLKTWCDAWLPTVLDKLTTYSLVTNSLVISNDSFDIFVKNI